MTGLVRASLRLRNNSLREEGSVGQPFEISIRLRDEKLVLTDSVTNLRLVWKLASQANTYYVDASELNKTAVGSYDTFLTPGLPGTYYISISYPELDPKSTANVIFVARSSSTQPNSNGTPLLLPGGQLLIVSGSNTVIHTLPVLPPGVDADIPVVRKDTNTTARIGLDDLAALVTNDFNLEQLNDTSFNTLSVGQIMRWNGTDWVNENVPYELAPFISSTMGASEVVYEFFAPRAFILPANAGIARSREAATNESALSILKNGVEIGNITFTAGINQANLVSTQTSFAPTDILSIVAPVEPDPTLADIAITLSGIR